MYKKVYIAICDYQEKFTQEIGGQVEVVMKDGTRCDILTATHAIEVDFSKKWAEAIGQSLNYSMLTDRKAGIVLILENESDEKHLKRLETIIASKELDIEVFVMLADDGTNPLKDTKGALHPISEYDKLKTVQRLQSRRRRAKKMGNISEGWAYALPTEAQWEYACRAGTTTAYSWGDSITTSDAKYKEYDPSQPTAEVGQYDPNAWGFHDMHGNVLEWTADWFDLYSSAAVTDPKGPASGSWVVIRGD